MSSISVAADPENACVRDALAAPFHLGLAASLPRKKCGPPVHIAEPAWCSLVVLLRGAYAARVVRMRSVTRARDAEWSNYVVMPALFFSQPGESSEMAVVVDGRMYVVVVGM